MAVVKNSDLEIMFKIEHLMMSEKRAKMIKDLDKKGFCMFNDEKITEDDINKFWNIIEKFINTKKDVSSRQNQWNKNHKEYHRIANNISNALKKKDDERLKYWRQQLKEYKERNGAL